MQNVLFPFQTRGYILHVFAKMPQFSELTNYATPINLHTHKLMIMLC